MELSVEADVRVDKFNGNGIRFYARIGMPVDLFLCPKVIVVSTVSFARKKKSIESKFRTLELFPLHMFLFDHRRGRFLHNVVSPHTSNIVLLCLRELDFQKVVLIVADSN